MVKYKHISISIFLEVEVFLEDDGNMNLNKWNKITQKYQGGTLRKLKNKITDSTKKNPLNFSLQHGNGNVAQHSTSHEASKWEKYLWKIFQENDGDNEINLIE